jgi:lipid-A-disaccharide synthase-like uncharacterized protein
MIESSFSQLIGYVGATLFVLSYFLLSYGKLHAGQPVYHLFNIFGALFLIINALNIKDMPTLFVNGVWLVIGVVTLMRILMGRKSKIKQ